MIATKRRPSPPVSSQKKSVWERVSSVELDHTSTLRMIEWRWNLQPLTVRDAMANNLALVLDFSANRLNAPQYRVPRGPFGAPCPGVPGAEDKWTDLLLQLISLGWPF